MKAYTQHHTTRADVPHKHSPMPHHIAGLSWTPTGYGRRIPTEHMIQVNGRWRRVYCVIFSNIGTLYIGKLAPACVTVNLQDE